MHQNHLESFYSSEEIQNEGGRTKKINKNGKKNKSKEAMKEVKRQRQRDRRANHKQYVAQLENKLQESQNKINALEERVKELEDALETSINRKNTEEIFICHKCQQNIQEENNQSIQLIEGGEEDPGFFFRDESFQFRIGTRSECILLMTMLCLIVSTIAQNPSSIQIIQPFSYLYEICSNSFIEFLSMRQQQILSVFSVHYQQYSLVSSCENPLIYTTIDRVSESSWFKTIFQLQFIESIDGLITKIYDLASLPKLQLLQKIASYCSQIPNEKTLVFTNLFRVNNGY